MKRKQPEPDVTVFQYQCTLCGKSYERDDVRYLCPVCAGPMTPDVPLRGVLSVQFDYTEIKRRFKREHPDWQLFSAVEERFFPPYPVGNTPFSQLRSLAEAFGFEQLWAKHDHLNPSGSLKDRASYLMVAEAARLNENTLVTASTGNAACSLAAAAAAGSKRAVIFVPASAPQGKLVQMLVHGARVIPVNGSYDDAFRLSLQFTDSHDGLNRNTAYHPLTIEGKKTAGLEIWAQNGFQVPDVILVPVGDGVIISGIYKAFYDLKQSGLIDHLPRLGCVQSESSDAVHHLITTGEVRPAQPVTLADSISVSAPSNLFMAAEAVHRTSGFSLMVSDEEILAAQSLLATTSGIFAEPSSAAVAAALPHLRDRNLADPDDQIVLLITGHGLKDVHNAASHVQIPEPIEPTLDAVENLPGLLP